MLRNEFVWLINTNCTFWGSFISIFTNITSSFLIDTKMSSPALNRTNRRLYIKHFMSKLMVSLIYSLLLLFLFNSEMAFRYKTVIISGISLLLNLNFRSCHDFSYSVNKSLVLSLQIISFEVRNMAALRSWRVRNSGSMGFYCWSCLSEVRVVPSFVLKVNELVSFFNIHLIILTNWH